MKNSFLECPHAECTQEITLNHRLTPYKPIRQRVADYLLLNPSFNSTDLLRPKEVFIEAKKEAQHHLNQTSTNPNEPNTFNTIKINIAPNSDNKLITHDIYDDLCDKTEETSNASGELTAAVRSRSTSAVSRSSSSTGTGSTSGTSSRSGSSHSSRSSSSSSLPAERSSKSNNSPSTIADNQVDNQPVEAAPSGEGLKLSVSLDSAPNTFPSSHGSNEMQFHPPHVQNMDVIYYNQQQQQQQHVISQQQNYRFLLFYKIKRFISCFLFT